MDRLEVRIDPSAGFCKGVEKAIQKAEDQIASGEKLVALGKMVHNDRELERLSELGLRTIQHTEMSNIQDEKVFLRAHGEPPETYERLQLAGIDFVDATCSIVTALQQKIKRRFESLDPEREQIVIFGKEGHPETIGLMGQTQNRALLVTDPSHLEHLDPFKTIYLFSQTTMDPDDFTKLEGNLGRLVSASEGAYLHAKCTICGQMRRRKPDLAAFAKEVGLLLFVSGMNSSNGKLLYDHARAVNPASQWIQRKEEIREEWLEGVRVVGLSGATSTPIWQLREIKDHLESLKLS